MFDRILNKYLKWPIKISSEFHLQITCVHYDPLDNLWTPRSKYMKQRLEVVNILWVLRENFLYLQNMCMM